MDYWNGVDNLYGRTEEEPVLGIFFSVDIGMAFGLDKCAVLVLKQGTKVRCEGIVFLDGHYR